MYVFLNKPYQKIIIPNATFQTPKHIILWSFNCRARAAGDVLCMVHENYDQIWNSYVTKPQVSNLMQVKLLLKSALFKHDYSKNYISISYNSKQ